MLSHRFVFPYSLENLYSKTFLLTAQNKRTKTVNNRSGLNHTYSNFDDFSLVINIIPSPPSEENQNQATSPREAPRGMQSLSHMKSFSSMNGSLTMAPYDDHDPFEFSSSISFPDEFPRNASTVSEMSWNGSESSISSSFMFVSSEDDSRPNSPNNVNSSNSQNIPQFSYAEMLSKGLNPVDYSDSSKMNHHFPPLSSKKLYNLQFSGKTSKLHSSILERSSFISRNSKLSFPPNHSPPSSLNIPSWESLENVENNPDFSIKSLPLWKKYRDFGIPNRDNYNELLKIWYCNPPVNQITADWFFDVWNQNTLHDQINFIPAILFSLSAAVATATINH